MNKAILLETVAGQELKDLPATVLHEDMATGLSANKFLDRFCGQAACGAKCEKNFWPLNLLHTPLLQEQAAAEAGRAVIIILSLVTKTGLPEVVQEWLSRWLDYREDRPYVFGVLLDGKLVGANDNNPVMACVEKFAGRAARKF